MQVFMGQAWLDHNADFMERALRADRITFADLGVVIRIGAQWTVECASAEAATFVSFAQRMQALLDLAEGIKR